MSHRTREKFYVVWEGRVPGVYTSWPEAADQVRDFAQAKFKSFLSRDEAEAAFRGKYWSYAGKDTITVQKTPDELAELGVNLDSIAVDSACSGAPGPMEYRGVRTRTGEQLFHVGPLEDGTANVGEFLAIVHALAWLKKKGDTDTPVYSDSMNARSWIRQRKCRTKLIPTDRNKAIFDLIPRAMVWLAENPVTNPVLTWDTAHWGEIPADFGRK